MKKSDIQSTPDWLFQKYDTIHHFVLDVAADRHNAKCDLFYGDGGIAPDALEVSWPVGNGTLWMNPPYSRGNQRKFVEKAIECAMRGGRVIALLPADTSTKLFHDLIWKRYHVEFLPKRVKFNGASNSAKFGSMVVDFSLRGDL